MHMTRKPVYIALDFDGVLHHYCGGPSSEDFKVLRQDGRRTFVQKVEREYPRKAPKSDKLTPVGRLFDQEHRLVELLKQFPQAKIVIATSWREHAASKQLGTLLAPTVRKRIVGVLDWDRAERTCAGVRGRLMKKWLKKHRKAGSTWIALDDQVDHYKKHLRHLVQPDWWGMDRKGVKQAARALTRRTAAPVELMQFNVLSHEPSRHRRFRRRH